MKTSQFVHLRAKKSGFSLVEMLVVMVIITIIGAVVALTVSRLSVNYDHLQEQAIIQREVTTSVERVGKVLRGTTSIITATETALRVRSYLTVNDTAPSEINYYLENGKWKFSVIAPVGSGPVYSYPANTQKVYTLMSGIVSSASSPLFRYYNQTSTLLAFPVVIADIRLIELVPQATSTRITLPQPVGLSTKIQLRNLKTNL